MSGIAQVIVTVVATVVTSTFVFLLGQVAMVLFIERIRVQARTIEEIAQALVMYAREYSTPIADPEEVSEDHRQLLRKVSDDLRRLGAVLRSTATTLRWYGVFETLRLVASRSNVLKASGLLIGLSNSVPPNPRLQEHLPVDEHPWVKYPKEIRKLLGIEVEAQEDYEAAVGVSSASNVANTAVVGQTATARKMPMDAHCGGGYSKLGVLSHVSAS